MFSISLSISYIFIFIILKLNCIQNVALYWFTASLKEKIIKY